MATPAQIRASIKYVKNNTRRWVLQCNIHKDGDIIDFLEGQSNVNALLKSLIRESMELQEKDLDAF